MAFSDPEQLLLTSDEMDAKIAEKVDGELQVKLPPRGKYISIDGVFKIKYFMHG